MYVHAGVCCCATCISTIDTLKERVTVITPPPPPLQRSKRDFSNFDVDFISEKACLTPVEREVVRHINQQEFEGFTFTNSEFKD